MPKKTKSRTGWPSLLSGAKRQSSASACWAANSGDSSPRMWWMRSGAMASGRKNAFSAAPKLLSLCVGGTHRSSAQKNSTLPSELPRVAVAATMASKNFSVIRPPESATKWGRGPFTDAISASHAVAAAAASSRSVANCWMLRLFKGVVCLGRFPPRPRS